MHPDFEAVIGLEVHAQLATDTKLFCGCRARPPEGRSVADEAVNSNTCPVCTGHPGTLPVLNRKAVAFAIKAGLATGCDIRPKSVFSRKNYFYPDLPKGYQISQYDRPICENGFLEIPTATGDLKRITIQRIHIEEDAGKNLHMSGFSLVNLNRACVPLIEIVTAPDMRTPEEAGAYLRALHAVVTYLEVCDGNMQEGNFRCDANVSVMPKGSKTLGTRAEIKNVNSFRFVEKAIEYEINRQIGVIQGGGKIVQETRLYDSAKGITVSMRSKEDAHDYRYFPEPDLLTVAVDEAWVLQLRESLPELPEQRKNRYIKTFGLSAYDAGQITASKPMAAFYEECISLREPNGTDATGFAKTAANFLTGEISRLSSEESLEIGSAKITPRHLADLVLLFMQKIVSSTAAKQIIASAWKSGDPVDKIVEREGLKQVSDTGALDPIVDQIVTKFPEQVAEYKSGKDKVIGFFVGQIMKATGGKANPALLQEIVLKKLKR